MEALTKTRRIIQIVLWVLAIASLATTLFLSSQTGEETAGLSHRIANFLGQLFGLTTSGITILHSLLRTAAHIVLYFITTVFSCAAVYATFPHHRTAWIWPMPVCSIIGIIDEIRKASIPGRHCSLGEAGLNVLGCVLGMLLILLIRHIIIKRQKKTV